MEKGQKLQESYSPSWFYKVPSQASVKPNRGQTQEEGATLNSGPAKPYSHANSSPPSKKDLPAALVTPALLTKEQLLAQVWSQAAALSRAPWSILFRCQGSHLNRSLLLTAKEVKWHFFI